MVEKEMPAEHYEHNLPFDVDMILPKFPYVAHSGFSKVMFAIIVGLALSGFLFLGYYLFY